MSVFIAFMEDCWVLLRKLHDDKKGGFFYSKGYAGQYHTDFPKLKDRAVMAMEGASGQSIIIDFDKGKKVYSFGFGQSPFPVPESIVNKLKENAHRKEYLPIQGLIELRNSISKYLEKKTGNFFLQN